MRQFLRKLKYFLSWLPVIWRDPYYDYWGIYHLLEHKLKRLEHAMTNGHSLYDRNQLKAIRLAIKLCGRLKNDDYSAAFDRHDKKWGEMISWFEPSKEHAGYQTWHSKRPKAITMEDKIEERNDFRAACDSEHMKRERDQKNFFAIMNKYIQGWWD